MSLLGLLAFLNTIRKKIDNYRYQYHFCNICEFFALNYINLPDISILCTCGAFVMASFSWVRSIWGRARRYAGNALTQKA